VANIETINKDEILFRWLVDGLSPAFPLTFEFLQMSEGWAAVAPIPSEAPGVFLDGSAERQYDFMLQLAFAVSDDADSPANTRNLFSLRQWQDWIDEQEIAGNYPDFGAKCSCYELINLSIDPTMAGRQDDGLAKYQFPARLIYLEDK